MASIYEPLLRARLPETSTHPKTSGKIKDMIWRINRRAKPSKERSFPYVGTVKLHGAHADIVFESNGDIKYQSRNCYLTPESDSYGFAGFCEARKAALIAMRETIRRRWGELHPETPEDEHRDITLAGEWIGTGIQKNVAISQLSRRFVICGIKVNENWEHIEEYHSISDEETLLFNILRGGIHYLDVSLADNGQAFMQEAEKLTMRVVESCPFAKTFGAAGAREGIVWTPAAHSALVNESGFWLKTKIENFHVVTPNQQAVARAQNFAERGPRAKQFAQVAYSEARMEQAWNYLRETGSEQSKRGMGVFLSWLSNDVEVEEKTEIQKLDIGSEWKVEGTRIAKAWFQTKLS